MTEIFVTYILGALPEAIYFSLFLIISKGIKEKRVLFTTLMFMEYVIIKLFISYDVWFQILYTIMTFIILKVLYREKAQITDIFTFAFSSLILVIISIVSYMFVYYTIGLYPIAYILNRLLLFGGLFIFRDKLNKLYTKFNRLWNRKPNQKIRSLTVRNVSVIIFNIMFYIINFCMVYFVTFLKK